MRQERAAAWPESVCSLPILGLADWRPKSFAEHGADDMDLMQDGVVIVSAVSLLSRQTWLDANGFWF